MKISLRDDMNAVTDAQAAERAYGSSSKYLHDLTCEQSDVATLRGMLLDGFNSGHGQIVDEAFFAELRAIAEGKTAP
ncbi:MAG: type II toxin-antitoxin system ParD family antitoxin [Dokdonella sp.]